MPTQYYTRIYDSYNHTTNETMCKSGNYDVNHAVVAVGLGTSKAGDDYYIIRNSWSALWGMEGHFWMKRNSNLCGVSDCASFPIVPVVGGGAEKQLRKKTNNPNEILFQSSSTKV